MKDKNTIVEIAKTGTLALTGLLLLGSLTFAQDSQTQNPCEGAYPEFGTVGTVGACFPEGDGAPIPVTEFTDPTAVPTPEPLTVPSRFQPVLVSGVEGYAVNGQDGVIPRTEFTDPR